MKGRRNGCNSGSADEIRNLRIVFFGLLAVGGPLSRLTFCTEGNKLVKILALLAWESLFMFVVSYSWHLCRLLDNSGGKRWLRVWQERLQGWCIVFCTTTAGTNYHIFVPLTKCRAAWRNTAQAARRFFDQLRREDPAFSGELQQSEHPEHILVQVIEMY